MMKKKIMDILIKPIKMILSNFLHLWYESDEITSQDLRDFYQDGKTNFFFKTRVRRNSKI